jgi:hypothetical protein
LAVGKDAAAAFQALGQPVIESLELSYFLFVSLGHLEQYPSLPGKTRNSCQRSF